MIKFFRRIRQKLLSENKFSKYLIYAIGEIILVVIGIMIALQVNNWNNQRAQDEGTKVIFNQIIDELIIDVDVIQDLNNYYIFKDSLIEAYKQADLKNMPRRSDSVISEINLIDMIRTFVNVEIHDRGFNLLMSHTDQLDSQYKEYIDELIFLYNDAKPMIDLYNERLKDLLYEHRMHKIKNHSWYSRMDSSLETWNQEFDYYKYDPVYRNYVKYYNEMIWNTILETRVFEDRAIKFCRKLNTDFDLNREIDAKLKFSFPPKNIINAIKGRYVFDKKDTLTFSEKNNQLYESTYDDQDLIYAFEHKIKVGELRYLGDSLFYRDYRYNLKLNTDNTVSLIYMGDRKPNILERIDD